MNHAAFHHLKQSVQGRRDDGLTTMPAAVSWAYLAGGRIQFVNRQFTAVFGYKLEALRNLDAWSANAYVKSEEAARVSRFWRTRGGPDHDGNGFDEIQLDIRCKDGSIKTVLSSKIFLPQEQWGLSTFVDITPLKEEESVIKRQALEDPL